MAKIISLASSKVRSIQGGYELNDPEYVQELIEDTDSIIGGISKGLNLFVNDGERYYVAYITGDQTFADLPKLFEITPLSAPTLTSPADNAEEVAVGATITWNNVTGNQGYEISLNGQIFQKPTNSHVLAGVADTEYTWKVRAIGELIKGTWSAERTFTTA